MSHPNRLPPGVLAMIKGQPKPKEDPRTASRRTPAGWISPKPGMVWNPLERYPANLECCCGSRKKFKDCHKPRLQLCVDREMGKHLDEYMKLINSGARPILDIRHPGAPEARSVLPPTMKDPVGQHVSAAPIIEERRPNEVKDDDVII